MARILIFDIEATNLNANFGYVLCIGYRWYGTKTTTVLSITNCNSFKKDPTNDLELIEKFRKVWEKADIVIAHYGKKFDIPYLNTRLLIHGRTRLPETPIVDTWQACKYQLKLNSNRLDSLIAAVGCPIKKTHLSGPIWVKASAGDKPSIKYVVDHCRADVDALHYCYHKIKGLINQHPTVQDKPEQCTACSGSHFRNLGWRRTATRVYRRYICLGCGQARKGELKNG